MAESMKLELVLRGDDQLSKFIQKNIKALKDFRKEADGAAKTVEKLMKAAAKGKDAKGFDFSPQLKKSGNDADKLAKKLTEIVNLSAKAAKISADSKPSQNKPKTSYADYQTDSPTRGQGKSKNELDKIFGKDKKQAGLLNRAADFNDRYLEPTKQIASVWRDEYDSLKQYTNQAQKLLRLQARFKTINLPEAENQKASAAIDKAVEQFSGLSKIDATEIFTNLFNTLGSVEAAINALPFAAKYSRSMNALYGDVFSPEQTNRQIQSSYKFAELTGATENRAELEKTIDALTKITNSTGGEITSANLLLAAKRGKTSMKNLSPKGLLNVAAIIDEFGGDNTGTALMSLSQSLVGGKMAQKEAARFDYFGLLDRSKIEYGSGQKIKKLLPGANKLGDAVQEDPQKAADMLRDAMKAKGVDVTNAKEVDKQLYGLFGNRNAQSLMSKYINDREQVQKEASRAENAKGVIGLDQQIFGDHSQLAKLQEFEATWDNLKAELGMPMLSAGSDIAKTVTPILKMASEHPELMKLALGLIAVSKGINLFGQTASILKSSGSGISSLFSRLRQDADLTTESVRRSKTEINNLSKGGSVYNKVKSSFSKPVPFSLQVAAIIGLEHAITAQVEGYLNAIESQKNRDKVIGYGDKSTDAFFKEFPSVESIKNRKDLSERDKQELIVQRENTIKSSPQGVWSKLNDGNSLMRSLGVYKDDWSMKGIIENQADRWKYTWYTPGLKDGYRNNFGTYQREKAVDTFKKEGGELKFPEMMKEFLRSVPQLIPGNTEKDRAGRTELFEVLKTAFPDSYKQASAELAREQMTLGENSRQLSEFFGMLKTPSSELSGIFPTLKTNSETASTQVGNLATQAESAATRLASVQFNAPNITFSGNTTTSQPGNQTNKKPNIAAKLAYKDPFTSLTGRARGGAVQKNQPFLVGEVGREIFVPNQSGSIIPNEALRRVSKAREILKSEQQRQQEKNFKSNAGFSTEIGFNPSFPETEKNRLKPTSSNPRESFSPFRIKENRERKVFNREGGNADSEIANNVSVSRRGGSLGAPNIFNITVQVQGNVADAERTGQMIGSAVVREIEKRMQSLESRVSTVEYDTNPRRLTRAVDRVHQRRSELT